MILRGFVHSEILEKDTGITVVTPHILNKKKYKIAYLLHGLGGEQSTWPDFSMLPFYALEGETVYVMPNAERSFYTDMKYGLRFFTYVSEELPQICQSLFNIASEPENTAIIGVSMGGYGALKCAATNPGKYSMCGAIAPACLFLKQDIEALLPSEREEEIEKKYGQSILKDLIRAFGEELEINENNDIVSLFEKNREGLSSTVFYTACGKQDPYRKDNLRFCDLADKLGIIYNYEEWDGGHEIPFFNQALKKAIERFHL